MKKLIIPFFVFLSITAFAQIDNMAKATKVSKINTKAFDPGCCPVFLIENNNVSATPISIPAPNNQPIKLSTYKEQMSTFNAQSVISDCSLLSYKNNQLRIRVSYYIRTQNNNPVYAGAWFYDKYDNAVEVGYTPEMITLKPSGKIDVILEFKKLPITTEYLKVMLLQDGKEIASRSFKAAFLWKGPEFAVMKSAAVATVISTNDVNKTIINANDVNKYVPDLEITAIKVIDTDQNTLPYETGCMLKDKVIFVTNRGTRESSPYILSVGYIKYNGNRGRYKEVERIGMASLLPGKQTLQRVRLPDDANNIRAEIIYNYNTNGESNTRNNSMEKKCISIK